MMLFSQVMKGADYTLMCALSAAWNVIWRWGVVALFWVSGCLWDWANVPNRVRSQAAHPTRIFQAASVYPQRQP